MVERRLPGRSATFVSPAEIKAAQMKVLRMIARDEEPPRALVAIADARGDFSEAIEKAKEAQAATTHPRTLRSHAV